MYVASYILFPFRCAYIGSNMKSTAQYAARATANVISSPEGSVFTDQANTDMLI